jgi:hypothetical protein
MAHSRFAIGLGYLVKTTSTEINHLVGFRS